MTLQWWQDRKPEEMPEYLKEEGGKIIKVDRYYDRYGTMWLEYGDSLVKNKMCVTHTTMCFFVPSTEAEYLNYLATKK